MLAPGDYTFAARLPLCPYGPPLDLQIRCRVYPTQPDQADHQRSRSDTLHFLGVCELVRGGLALVVDHPVVVSWAEQWVERHSPEFLARAG